MLIAAVRRYAKAVSVRETSRYSPRQPRPAGYLAFPCLSAIGNVVLAGPDFSAASRAALDQLGPLLTQEHDDGLELAMPFWWTPGAASCKTRLCQPRTATTCHHEHGGRADSS